MIYLLIISSIVLVLLYASYQDVYEDMNISDYVTYLFIALSCSTLLFGGFQLVHLLLTITISVLTGIFLYYKKAFGEADIYFLVGYFIITIRENIYIVLLVLSFSGLSWMYYQSVVCKKGSVVPFIPTFAMSIISFFMR